MTHIETLYVAECLADQWRNGNWSYVMTELSSFEVRLATLITVQLCINLSANDRAALMRYLTELVCDY